MRAGSALVLGFEFVEVQAQALAGNAHIVKSGTLDLLPHLRLFGAITDFYSGFTGGCPGTNLFPGT